MKEFGFLVFMMLLLTSCKKEITINGYKVNGTVKHIHDSTIIILKANHSRKLLFLSHKQE